VQEGSSQAESLLVLLELRLLAAKQMGSHTVPRSFSQTQKAMERQEDEMRSAGTMSACRSDVTVARKSREVLCR